MRQANRQGAQIFINVQNCLVGLRAANGIIVMLTPERGSISALHLSSSQQLHHDWGIPRGNRKRRWIPASRCCVSEKWSYAKNKKIIYPASGRGVDGKSIRSQGLFSRRSGPAPHQNRRLDGERYSFPCFAEAVFSIDLGITHGSFGLRVLENFSSCWNYSKTVCHGPLSKGCPMGSGATTD